MSDRCIYFEVGNNSMAATSSTEVAEYVGVYICLCRDVRLDQKVARLSYIDSATILICMGG